MAERWSFEAYLYILTTGTREAWPAEGVPENLSEIDLARDVTLNQSRVSQEANVRKTREWQATIVGRKNVSLSFQMLFDHDDTILEQIEEAYDDGDTVALAVLSGTTDEEGSRGIWADFAITEFNRGEAANDPIVVDVTAVLGLSDVAAERVEVVLAT